MDERSRRRGLLYFLVGLAVMATLAVAGENGANLQLWPLGVRITVPVYVLVALGFISGALVTRAVAVLQRDGTGPDAPVAVVLLCAGVLAPIAVRTGALSAAAALLVVLLGGAGVITAQRAVRLIDRGDAFEVQTHWGGLGGGLGGWRLSPATSLVLLSMFFGIGALGVGLHFSSGPVGPSVSVPPMDGPAGSSVDAADRAPAPSSTSRR